MSEKVSGMDKQRSRESNRFFKGLSDLTAQAKPKPPGVG
jgi:hypothetical protein